MPNITDFRPVIFYTHEQSDATHSTNDYVAFVVGVVNENTVDVVVFPPGGPLRWERVSRFDPSVPYDPENPHPVGQSYWRDDGEDPPDFEAAYAPPPEEPAEEEGEQHA